MEIFFNDTSRILNLGELIIKYNLNWDKIYLYIINHLIITVNIFKIDFCHHHFNYLNKDSINGYFGFEIPNFPFYKHLFIILFLSTNSIMRLIIIKVFQLLNHFLIKDLITIN